MLTKLTAKNQLTLPKKIVKEFEGIEYFDADVRDGQIILSPVKMQRVDANLEGIRKKIDKLGITSDDISMAVQWPGEIGLDQGSAGHQIGDEVFPFCEVVEVNEEISGACRDSADDKFLSCAVAAGVDAIVSGDKDLLDLGSFRNIPIISVSTFQQKHSLSAYSASRATGFFVFD